MVFAVKFNSDEILQVRNGCNIASTSRTLGISTLFQLIGCEAQLMGATDGVNNSNAHVVQALSLSLYPLSLSLSPPLCLSLSVSPLLLEFKLM